MSTSAGRVYDVSETNRIEALLNEQTAILQDEEKKKQQQKSVQYLIIIGGSLLLLWGFKQFASKK